ncbi:SDR family oxidoreductase [Sandaracinus amylolyticus]|uniref:3-oxoacyl-[acyl-carrier protein] reductase n=1 Tax=Sandaracinus amylolyticus TaxID=927083 RepID=A0A0F6YP66_9BACT|nr:SDR family oxidoreductase [Sandaracinus amylolyticus]AKF11160.1 3-oxoacyl-[acyl-carrier protein] reductase [Sandaracinus amylolyticus]
MTKLANKVAVITGGTTGIGLATAKLFDAEGASLVLTGRDAAAIESARRELPRADVLAADQSSLADVDRLVEHVRARHGRVDVLFVNAGIAKFRPFEAVDERFFDELVGVNLKGAFFTVQRFAPILRDGASVVLNTSVAGVRGPANATIYALSKAGLRSLARTLSTELAPRGIRVNAISPGPIETPIFGKTGADADVIAVMKQSMSDAVPMKRLGTADEVARATLFLASTDSSFVLGSELAVDGGLTQL